MAAGRVHLSSAIFYIFFILYRHQLFYKSLSNNADIPNIYKSNFLVKFSPQHFVIGYLNQYFTTPRVHRWNCSRKKKKFLSTRTYFYRNSVASFNLTRLSLSGDINPNPGPIATANSKPKCSICFRTIARNHRSVVCTTCKSNLHIKCCGLSVANYKQIHLGDIKDWSCSDCNVSVQGVFNFSDSFFEQEDAIELSPSTNTSTTTDFNILDKYKANIKIAHFNVNSLAGFKFHEVKLWLSNYIFDVLVLTETKLDHTFLDTI